jgi:hypothetical protein
MAYYVLHKFHVIPSVFLRLQEEERAFICASISLRVEAEKKENAKIKRK